jgi:hypothetical protein
MRQRVRSVNYHWLQGSRLRKRGSNGRSLQQYKHLRILPTCWFCIQQLRPNCWISKVGHGGFTRRAKIISLQQLIFNNFRTN